MNDIIALLSCFAVAKVVFVVELCKCLGEKMKKKVRVFL